MDSTIKEDVLAISKIEAVERILEVVCQTTGLGFSAVARVTDEKWVACAVRDLISFGLKPGGELQLTSTICNEIRQSGTLVVIDDASVDPHFCGHPTPLQYGFKSYISVPIKLPTGEFFGTLCAIDPKPAKVNTPTIINMFKLFADLIGQHLDTQRRIAVAENALFSEREATQLREQFIAVLGHDLRNPLAAIDAATVVLESTPHSKEDNEFFDMIHRSVNRMAGLINNVLDFARGRLGGGLSLNRAPDPQLQSTLEHVVDELQAASERNIERRIAINAPVSADAARLAQLLSNLLANALHHGDPKEPVHVHIETTPTHFELAVTNRGVAIPKEVQEKLFQPFARGSVKPGQQGLGLGLYIASEIARAHDGVLHCQSTAEATTFAFRMPTVPQTPRN
jgi:K+-sensing histidine kinase KdpD